MKNLTALALVPFLAMSCGQNERQKLQSEVDSLTVELQNSQQATHTLIKAVTLMDSIDASRRMIRFSLEKGTSYDDFLSRMEEMRSFVEETQQQITKLEKIVSESETAKRSYAKNLKNLRQELEEKKAEIASLEKRMAEISEENKGLIALVDLQKKEIEDRDVTLVTMQVEIELLEKKVEEMTSAFKISEADAAFTKGQAFEMAANRTQFAPKRKKQTYKEAITYYERALELGRTDAKEKIESLKKKTG